jgi:hypothetical protein
LRRLLGIIGLIIIKDHLFKGISHFLETLKRVRMLISIIEKFVVG